MTDPILFQNRQVTAGIGKETTYGTAVTPGFYLPFTALAPDDVNVVAADQAWRGAPGDAWGYASAPLSGAVPFGGDVHPDTIGFPLAGVLGDVVASGSGPVTWTMACLNSGTQQPSSYTVTSSDGVNSRQWPGTKFTSLTLSAQADGALQYSATAVSLISNTTTAPSPSYTTPRMVPSWVGAHQLGGSPVGTVINCSVKLTRAVQAKRNNDGSPSPYLQRSGVLSVSGSLTLILETDAYRELYVAGTASSILLNWSQGAGSTATETQIRCSQIIYTNVQPDYATGIFQQVKLDWAASYNPTDVGASGGTSPCLVTLKNAVTSGSY